MAGNYDNEQQRMIDRIRCIAFREDRDAGATFINRQWVAEKVNRTTRFVTECQDTLLSASGKQRKSSSVVAKEIAEKHGEYLTPRTISDYRHREGLKPFHVISKRLKTETHILDRLWLCDWLKDWVKEDFLHLAPSDGCYVWTVLRPNYQNDRIWPRSIEDIAQDDRYREMVRHQAYIGIFVMFTCKRLIWVIKDKGESWTGEYFRGVILTQNLHLFQDNDVNFWGNDIWLGNSRDLNVAEHIGSIIKDEVEKKMLSEAGNDRYLGATLKIHIEDVLTNMEEDTELFETLLCSYPFRLRAVNYSNHEEINYYRNFYKRQVEEIFVTFDWKVI
ncbi:unnamed protein product [Adineta ricciae]|uniref:Transposase n=1 Tax=Adineta ricciae TaxID=249248 RepID=A0A816G8E6_ADIRI|nr:unnamed protein product [Adineta ricciae]